MCQTAHAAVARVPGGDFTLETVEIDAPRPDEVLVRIAGVGICHTDLVFSERLTIMKPPAVLGHEGAGVVERVGSAVTKVAVGDHVVLTFNSCGQCRRCRVGQPAYCFAFPKLNYGAGRPDGSATMHIGEERVSANFFGQSSFATYALASERNVVAIDFAAPLALMGPLGCGVQTGAGAIMRSLACPPGSTLLVIGGGAVGLSAVLGAVVQGCSRIVLAEPRPERRALALEFGATDVIDPVAEDMVAAVRALVPEGVDFAFDSSGLKQVINATFGCLAPHAKFGLVGVPPGMGDTLEVPINVVVGGGISIVGILEGDSLPDEFIPQLVTLYRAGKFPFDRMISTYRLDEINTAITDQARGACIKPVLLTD